MGFPSLQNAFASVLGGIDTITPGRAFQTINTELREPEPYNPINMGAGGDAWGDGGTPVAADTSTGGISLDGGVAVSGGLGGPSAAEFGNVKSDILQKAEATKLIFDSLFKGVDKVVNDRQSRIQRASDNTQTALANQSTQQANNIAQQWAGRGLADSSFNAKGQGAVVSEFDRLSQLEREANQADLAGLGQYAAETKAGFNVDRATIDRLKSVVNQIGDTGTADDLTTLQNARDQIDQILNERKAQQASFNTQSGFLGQLNAIAPQTNRLEGLNSQLLAIANSVAPQEVKLQIGKGFIANSGLTPEEQAVAEEDFLTQIGV